MKFDLSLDEVALLIRAASIGRLVEGEFTVVEQAVLKHLVKGLDAKRREVSDEPATDA